MTGNLEDLALYAGQSVGLISDVRSASEVMNALASETVLAFQHTQTLLSAGEQRENPVPVAAAQYTAGGAVPPPTPVAQEREQG